MEFNKFGSDILMVFKNISLNRQFCRMEREFRTIICNLTPRAVWLGYTFVRLANDRRGSLPHNVLVFDILIFMFGLIF